MTDNVRRSRKQIVLASCAAFAAISAPGSALAQDASDVTSSDEIVVTAQKRSENILDVPAAVSAVSAEMLAETHATQLTDIGAYIPAFQVDSGGTPGQTTLSIRGIAPVGPGATVATYVDETPIGTSSAYGGGVAFSLDLLPYDVERLEVLRGPQGTLYGASSMGGLLKYVLTSPSLDTFETRLGGDVFSIADGNDIGGGVRASLNGPLVENVLAATASYSFQDTPGFIDNSVTGEEDQNSFEQESGRVGLLWQASPDFSVRLNGLYQRVDADGYSTVALDPTTLEPLGGERTDNNLTDNLFTKKIEYLSAQINYDMSWASLISATSYSNTETVQLSDTSYSWGVAFPFLGLPAGSSQNTYRLKLEKVTQEFRLQSPGGERFEWLLGAFGAHEESSNFQSPSILALDGSPYPVPGLDPIYIASLPSTYTEAAVFGGLTFHVTDQWDIFGGVRYATNWQTFSEIASSTVLGLVIDLRDQKAKDDVTTYSIGTRYNLTDDVMVYGRVATGYQPGGPNLVLPGIPPTFDANTVTNYELGLKGSFLNNRLIFDGAVFNIDWEDIQVLTSAGAGFSYGANGGTARSRGAEVTVSARPTDNFSIDATVAYIDAVLTEDADLIDGETGDRLPNIPRLSGSLRVSYEDEVSPGWTGEVGAGLRFVDDRFSTVSGADTARAMEGYSALDLDASISNDRYTLRFFAKNVTDENVYLSLSPMTNFATGLPSQYSGTVMQPRTIGLALDARF